MECERTTQPAPSSRYRLMGHPTVLECSMATSCIQLTYARLLTCPCTSIASAGTANRLVKIGARVT